MIVHWIAGGHPIQSSTMSAAATATAAATTTVFRCFASLKQTPLSSNPQQPIHQLSVTPKSLFQKHPLYMPAQKNVPHDIKEKILCLEIMGIDSGKALAQNPSLHSTSLNSVHSVLSFLQSKGILQNDFARIFGMCPQILTSNVKSHLIPVFKFLSQDLNVPDRDFRKVINKCPRLLVSSVEDQLKPCLFFLQRLGLKDLKALAYQYPILLVSNVEHILIPKLKFLQSLGFSKHEVVGMVLRCPTLFTFSVEKNLKPKFDYFYGEMKGKLEDLKEFPQYFGFSLEKRIKTRHAEAVQARVVMPLSVMLKSTDEEFNELMRQGAV